MSILKRLENKLKFELNEFNLCKRKIEKLFEEEIQSHKSKKFINVGLTLDNRVIIVETNKFKVSLNKKIAKGSKIVLKSDIELYNISKNNIKKNSDRIRWIIETVNKTIKLNNNSLTKIEMFTKLYKDNILEDLKKENINLICKNYIDFIAFCDDDIKFDFKGEDEYDYDFVLLNSNSKIITKDILNKVNKLINIILKYWNEMKN